MIVIRCDGCGATAPTGGDEQVGWLQIRRFTEEEEATSWIRTSTHFEVVGHCCSLACMVNLALAQNDDRVSEELAAERNRA